MKKITILLITLFTIMFSFSQTSKTVNVKAGKLNTFITKEEKSTITDLIIIGSIDFRDFKFMRNDMLVLENLDISNTSIKYYYGVTEGTYLSNTIPENVFFKDGEGHPTLESIILPNSLLFIDNSAFQQCKKLTGELVFPESTITIGHNSFNQCSGIESIIIPESVISVGNGAFERCLSLNKVILKNEIPIYFYKDTFWGNSYFMKIYVPDNAVDDYKEHPYWKNFSINSISLISNFNSIPHSNIKVYSNQNSELVIEGIENGESISIYSIDGQKKYFSNNRSDKVVVKLPINTLYIIKTSNNTYKIML